MGKANGRTRWHQPGECLPVVNADRQKKLTAAKKTKSHRANEKKKPSKKETETRNWKVLRNKARDTRSIEKHLAACPDLFSHFYDGFLGSQADMDIMYWEDLLPDLNEYDDFDDYMSESERNDSWIAREIRYDDLIAELENRWL